MNYNDFNDRYRDVVHFDLNFYNKIINSIAYAIENNNLNATHFLCLSLNNYMPAITSFSGLQHKGCNIYSKLNKKSKINLDNIKNREQKWLNRLGLPDNAIDWQKLYNLNASITFDNHLKFFNILVLKDNLETNTRQVYYRTDSNMCTFCNQAPETTLHLLWSCSKVTSFRREISRNIGNDFYFLNNVPNLPRFRLLGVGFSDSDSLKFIFYLSIYRYIWLTKHFEGDLNLQAFKNHFSSFINIQTGAEHLTCLEDLDFSNLWR